MEVIAIAALTAAIIMLIINAFEKDKKVTYKQTLAIASLSILVTIPFTFAGTIIQELLKELLMRVPQDHIPEAYYYHPSLFP